VRWLGRLEIGSPLLARRLDQFGDKPDAANGDDERPQRSVLFL
jgi:hypothetical protein